METILITMYNGSLGAINPKEVTKAKPESHKWVADIVDALRKTYNPKDITVHEDFDTPQIIVGDGMHILISHPSPEAVSISVGSIIPELKPIYPERDVVYLVEMGVPSWEHFKANMPMIPHPKTFKSNPN